MIRVLAKFSLHKANSKFHPECVADTAIVHTRSMPHFGLNHGFAIKKISEMAKKYRNNDFGKACFRPPRPALSTVVSNTLEPENTEANWNKLINFAGQNPIM